MKLMKCVFFPLKEKISIKLDDEEHLIYSNYEEFEDDFRKGLFVAQHLKNTIIHLLCELIDPIKQFIHSELMNKII